MSGRFLTFEGGEGAGKSTQARLLAATLRDRGMDVVLTREPGGTEGAEAIRALLLGGSMGRWGGRAEALLFAAARADHVEKLIRPALVEGRWVICDRFLDSTRAYQGAEGIADTDVLSLHGFGSEGLMPDRTLLLALPPEQGAARAARRDLGQDDRFSARDAGFHTRVAEGFDAIARSDPARVRRVDATGDPAGVAAAVLAELNDLLPR